jgi:hypothetical protein
MEARPTPRRLLLCAAAIAALISVTSACGGGGGNAHAAARHDPPLRHYSGSSLSFSYPAAWTAYPPAGPRELHFQPLVYLSTQPVHAPCTTRGNGTTCGWPVRKLQPGGVLALWQRPYVLPGSASGTPQGTRIKVDGHRAWRVERSGGDCSRIGADRTIEVSLPALQLVVCLRRPGVAQNEKRIDAMLASTRLRKP